MKAQDLKFTQLLEGAKQFIIPIFQRTYSWERSHCEQLWNDIVRVGENPELCSHFIGSAVYIPDQDTSAAISRWLVIDGQQRITTLILLLLSFQRRLEKEGLDEPVTPGLIRDYYLMNPHGKGELGYKLLLTKADKNTLIALLEGKDPVEPVSRRVLENFSFFRERMAGADLDTIYGGIQKLMIVDVRLQQGLDNPQMIFESMNSTGKALTQADLIRNFVLMGLEHDLQTRLYEEYWRPMEVEFGAESYISKFDEFMRYYLVIHTGDVRMRKGDVYDAFKSYSQGQKVESLLASLREFADYYCRIALGAETNRELSSVLHDIRELGVDVCYPMLMELFQDYQYERIDLRELITILRMVESYVFRRAVCDVPTNSMRQTFATLMRQVKKDRYVESVKAAFRLLPSYRRFPDDREFIRQIQTRNLYKFSRRSYWLRRFENHGRKEHVPVQDYTIEHIMPQNENLSTEWRNELGDDWQRVHQQYLHTLGNLTLTGYNAEYSDRPFRIKRDMDGGFKDSPLKLNRGLGKVDGWNETAINARAAELAQVAAEIWAIPSLADELIEAYRPKSGQRASYSLADHAQLSGGLPLQLFTAFRAEVLALDECVTEEILKLYIAFKAETNFVDVVPQAKGLRLSLNLDFPEIDDPRGICKDVTNLGRWGNGNVEVKLESLSDMTYVLGLVRQALEKQLGDDSDDI